MIKAFILVCALVANVSAQGFKAPLVRAQQYGNWSVTLGTHPISVNIENAPIIVKSTSAITAVDTPTDIVLSTVGWTNLTPITLPNRSGIYVTNYLTNTMVANVVVTSFTAVNLGISTNTATIQLSKGDSVSLRVGEQIYIWGHSTTNEERLCVTQF